MTREQEQIAQRLRCALDMHEAGVALMLQNLRRRFPNEAKADIDRRLIEWLSARSGGEIGDCPTAPQRPTR